MWRQLFGTWSRGVRREGGRRKEAGAGSRVWPGSGTDFMLYNFRYANGKQRLALCQPGEVLRCHLRGNTHSNTHTHRHRDKHTRSLTLNPARGGYAIFTTFFFFERREGCKHTRCFFDVLIHQIFMPYFSYCDNELNLMESHVSGRRSACLPAWACDNKV